MSKEVSTLKVKLYIILIMIAFTLFAFGIRQYQYKSIIEECTNTVGKIDTVGLEGNTIKLIKVDNEEYEVTNRTKFKPMGVKVSDLSSGREVKLKYRAEGEKKTVYAIELGE